jgi:hypothetical protein
MSRERFHAKVDKATALAASGMSKAKAAAVVGISKECLYRRTRESVPSTRGWTSYKIETVARAVLRRSLGQTVREICEAEGITMNHLYPRRGLDPKGVAGLGLLRFFKLWRAWRSEDTEVCLDIINHNGLDGEALLREVQRG